jgi:hypothetical protein
VRRAATTEPCPALPPCAHPGQEPIQRRARQLEIQGPVWRAPSVREVLRGLPFFHHVPQSLFNWLLEQGQLLGEPWGVAVLAGCSAGAPVSGWMQGGEPPCPSR